MFTVDYDYYSCTYGGSEIPREVFDIFANRASVLLSSMLRHDKEQIQKSAAQHVLCEICDRLYRENGRDGISQESVDGYNVTYSGSVGHEILQLVRQNFGESGVLYRGRRL